jgi:hypothetical protein
LRPGQAASATAIKAAAVFGSVVALAFRHGVSPRSGALSGRTTEIMVATRKLLESDEVQKTFSTFWTFWTVHALAQISPSARSAE